MLVPALAALAWISPAVAQVPGPRAVRVGDGPLLFATVVDGLSEDSVGTAALHVLDPEGELPPQLVWLWQGEREVPKPLARADRSRVVFDYEGRGWVLDLDQGLATPFVDVVSSELVDARAGTITFVAPRLWDPKTALVMPSRLFVREIDASAEPKVLVDLGIAAVLAVAGERILVLAADRRICIVGRSGGVDPIGSFTKAWEPSETTGSISPSGRYAALVAKGDDLDRRGKRGVAVLDLVAGRILWSREQDWDRPFTCGFCGPFREPPPRIEWHGDREDLLLEPFGPCEPFGLETASGQELTVKQLMEIVREGARKDGSLPRLDTSWLRRYGHRATSPDEGWVAWTGFADSTLHVEDAKHKERARVPGTWALGLSWLPAAR
jgi:hypothetical protein